jgi:predicted RNase H-like nuclease (RuvC/YqgF family)
MSETHDQGSFYQEEHIATASSFTEPDQVKQDSSSLNVELLNTIAQRDQLAAELEHVRSQSLTFEQSHHEHLQCTLRIQQLTAEIDRLQLELQASKDSLTTITVWPLFSFVC